MQPENPTVASAVKVLVVDAEPLNLQAIANTLRMAGYDVIERATGDAALAAAPQADLVVLDIHLPDGFEVCRQLRANPETAALPVVLLAAKPPEAADCAVAAEVDGYLTHTVALRDLLTTLKSMLFARQADRMRRGTAAKLSIIFDLAPAAIAVLDGQYRYESVNPAYCVLTGYCPEELIGNQVSNAPDTNSDALFVTAVPYVEKFGRWDGELPLQRKDRSVVEVAWKIAKEAVSGASILVATDMTQRMQGESERGKLFASERAARAEAERSNRLKDEFLATLSHELRNPLNAILGWSTLLGRRVDLPANVMQGIHAIERNSKLQAKMIADLLDYAGIAFGKMRLIAATVDPYTSVRAALDAVRPSAAAQEVELQVSFGPEPARVEADATRLQQVVWNLLSNAIKFSPKGSTVEVFASRVANSFRLVVKDNGKGISPNFLPCLFDRFSQQDATSTRSFGGLGLGLAIAKHLVELHGGSIEAFSAGEERGAAFTIHLPLSDKELPVPSLETQRLRSHDLTGVTALVVEDDPDARELTKRILSDAGAEVVEAASAEVALKCVSTTGANILISDVGMADQDGYQLVRNLRALGYSAERLPAVALTAFARVQDRHQALAAGFQEHLVKPFDPQQLISRVAILRPPRKNS